MQKALLPAQKNVLSAENQYRQVRDCASDLANRHREPLFRQINEIKCRWSYEPQVLIKASPGHNNDFGQHICDLIS